MPGRSVLVRQDDRQIAVISAPPADIPDNLDQVRQLGQVGSVVAPNSFHYLFAADFAAACPGARVLVTPGLAARTGQLHDATELDGSQPDAWANCLDTHTLMAPDGIAETVFLHKPSGSLVLTDLAFNMASYPRAIDRLVWRAAGAPAAFGPSRTSRTFLLADRAATGSFLQQVLEWDFQRIVPGHGDIIENGARQALQQAFSDYL